MVNQAEIHRMALSDNVGERRKAVELLQRNFAFLDDKEQAWADFVQLVNDENNDVQWSAAYCLDSIFLLVIDRNQAWSDMGRLIEHEDSYVRRGVVDALRLAFPRVNNKNRACVYLRQLMHDKDGYVLWDVIETLVIVFKYIPDKKQAWEDLIRLIEFHGTKVWWNPSKELTMVFPYVFDKEQAFNDIIRLIHGKVFMVRFGAVESLGEIYQYVPFKTRVWENLIRLTHHDEPDVRVYANYSLGKASIFKAIEVENEEDFGSQLESAIEFFERSSKESPHLKPAGFCLPFYRSFYTLTFKKEDAKAEIQKYLVEAKSAVEGSESKEKLIEAVENLGNALKEAQKMREMDFNTMKCDFNAYRRYIERATELLETTGEKAPGATQVIKKGLPIIDERIKGILAEIQEKTKSICIKTQGTFFEHLGREVYTIGQNLQVENPIILEKRLNNLLIISSAICAKMLGEKAGESCELLKRANEEQFLENKIEFTNEALSKIIPHIGSMTKIDIRNSKDIQINTGDGYIQKNVLPAGNHDNIKPQNKSRLFNFINISAIAATLSGFGTYVISETLDVIPVTDYKHLINVVLAIIIFMIVLLIARKYNTK